MQFNSSKLEHPSHLIRFLNEDGVTYSRMICVTELEDGKVLFLVGWIGKPLSPREWREARDQLFPNAEEIRFERADPETGLIEMKSLFLRPNQ